MLVLIEFALIVRIKEAADPSYAGAKVCMLSVGFGTGIGLLTVPSWF